MEVRIQINDGVTATNITRKDVVILLDMLERYVEQDGISGSLGANLPAN